jgi:alginate O-acetyltransferase complex protein AlgI
VAFNSYEFALFLPAVLLCYYSLKSHHARLWLLFVASSIFYASWSAAYLLLLYASVVIDYWVGRALVRHETKRRAILLASLVFNLGVLSIFKYADFILQNLAYLGTVLGFDWHPPLYGSLPPLGISFYTFLTLSYTIDVYRRLVPAERSLLNYGVFVTFFPHLIAGPILRGKDFLPQVMSPRPENYRPWFGINRMAIGFIKKAILADTLATFVEPVYAHPGLYDGVSCLLATYAYAFQIFFDFSGYCDIAMGAAALLGYELPVNFDSPYLARNITTFWRRWHMTLSAWLRDYLYITLGGSRKGRRRTYVNLMLTMLLGGLWHGASWNFVIWGGLHGVLLAIHKMWVGRPRSETPEEAYQFNWRSVALFLIVCLTWVFFRAQTLDAALGILRAIALVPAHFLNGSISLERVAAAVVLPPAVVFTYSLCAQARRRWELFEPGSMRQALAYGCAMASVVVMLASAAAPPAQFIYFRF